MINLFIIHTGNDSDYVLNTAIPELLGNVLNKNINILMLGSKEYSERYTKVKEGLLNKDNFEVRLTDSNWKKEAKKSIIQAHAVLVIVGKETLKKEKTIGLEVKWARKHGKLIFLHKIKEEYKTPDFLKEVDQFTYKVKNIANNQSLEQIRERLINFDLGYYDIFSDVNNCKREMTDNDKDMLMKQYTMYQKTSEDLVERRQNVSSFYLTANGSIVTLTGVIIGLVDFPQNLFILLGLSIFGIILDISWLKILEAYGLLNSAKMKVISLMEKQLPINLYDSEWNIMSDRLNKEKYVSFTTSEKRIPIIFIAIFSVILISSLVLIISHYIVK